MSGAPVALRVLRRAATQAEVDAELSRLDAEVGVYFGCDAGIPGMHPLQARLAVSPAVVMRVYGDGLEIRPASACGDALLAHPALQAWSAASRRGGARRPLDSLRAWLSHFEPSADVLLLGALQFEAHCLASRTPANDGRCLGFLLFPRSHWHRDADGRWEQVELDWDGFPAHAAGSGGPIAHPGDEHYAAVAQHPANRMTSIADDFPPGGYARMVERALGVLRERPLISLTLSQSYRRAADLSPVQAFARLRTVNPAPATFFFNDGGGERVFGASPDLQLVVCEGEVVALPVCGTVARGPGAVGEARSLRQLLNEEVDAASLAVCSDAMRNDLAPLCEPGSLHLTQRLRPMSLATVVHTVDRLHGRLRDGADAWDAILATTAPAMLTGTPRSEALAAISQLEVSPRGWYGGLMVQVASNGEALAGTILRAATVLDGWAEVRTGGDLLADSVPVREEQESRLKAISLWRALGVEPSTEAPDGVAVTFSRHALHAILIDAGDPFPASMADALAAAGVSLNRESAAAVLIGTDAQRCATALAAHPHGMVAIGDAGLRMLEADGCALAPSMPAHGRAIQVQATESMPAGMPATFAAARYASLALREASVPGGWQVWARDAQGLPAVVAQPESRRIGLLVRPDSLLADADAMRMLRAAVEFAAGGG